MRKKLELLEGEELKLALGVCYEFSQPAKVEVHMCDYREAEEGEALTTVVLVGEANTVEAEPLDAEERHWMIHIGGSCVFSNTGDFAIHVKPEHDGVEAFWIVEVSQYT